jgi:hypothetical protein
MFCIKNGIPFDVAFAMDDAERLAACVAFGELNGGVWSWDSMRWQDRT